ncbi:HNH endonuclease [Bacillus sp. TH22]|uniref:HNH endonuclease n=1 Tax=unclassified Bacillus (in: firmicutes) TaxID=185979 RepID=UPI0019146FB0|nr:MULTISPECIES: HNH endonuclease [unclassified Bacillus (in: firmicutes)]MBK5452155.1 HNH endonuclease [Bacillus sp. TH22]MBK5454114.1 HNH endonuclease [Bacillus sp. TH23]
MDVKYRPEPWQDMGDGMNRITKDALIKLRYANELLKRIDGRIRDLDSDGSIHFNPKDQSQKIGELLESYSTLQKYCGEAGRVVSEHIDKPFLVEMDKFAQKMRDTSILSFTTNNRIGSTTTTVLPDAHAGYGSVPQTIKTKKDKITVEDIFKDSPAFDNVLRGEYKELKKQNPDAKLNYEEYKKVVPSTRGFEYKSIEDEQKKLEMVRDIGIGLGIIITTILCPPLGAAAAVVYGAVQIKSGIDGEDWGTHRKLSQEERVGNIIFGGLDAIPVVGAVGKGVKAFKGTSELADLAKLLKYKEGMPGFNPNLGKNVVQSLKENNLLKNLKIQGWKTVDKINDADYFIKGLVAKGVDSVSPFVKGVEILPDGSVARTGTNYSGKFQEAHDASKASIQSRISNLESGGVKGTGNREAEVPPAFRQTDFASSYEARYNQTPSPINSKVEFEGIRGESLSTLKPPPDPKLKRILDEAGIKGIQYKNGVPDFSPVSKAQIEIDYMLGGKGNYGTKARTYNFAQADQKLADKLNDSVELARQFGMEPGGVTAKDIDKYRTKNQLTWHEVNDVKIMQLVPTEINKRFGHLGGVGEINAGAFEPGGFAKK